MGRHRNKLMVLIILTLLLMLENGNVARTAAWSSLTPPNTHGRIGMAAIEVMPDPWKTFLSDHMQNVSDACNFPDEYKGLDPQDFEYARHYDDSDTPHNDHTAIGGSSDWALGVIEWATENATRDLTTLIKNNASDADIIYQLGFVCHYAADSTMPFHATTYFDGYNFSSSGVHGRVEENVFKAYSDNIFANLTVESPKYIENPYTASKANIASGLALVPQWVEADLTALAVVKQTKVQSDYTRVFFNLMNQSLIDRISLAAQFAADLWYTAIVNAQPEPTSTPTTTTSPTSSTLTSENTSSNNKTPVWFPYLVIIAIPIYKKRLTR